MTYEKIQAEEIVKELDTDYGLLRANWKTCSRLIEQKDRLECKRFLRYIRIEYGQFKAVEMRGDMIDAGILTK